MPKEIKKKLSVSGKKITKTKVVQKGAPKQKVNIPNSFANGAPIMYKPPQKKQSLKWGNPKKASMGDLSSRANPNAKSESYAGTLILTENGMWVFKPNIILKDGTVFNPPLKKRSY